LINLKNKTLDENKKKTNKNFLLSLNNKIIMNTLIF